MPPKPVGACAARPYLCGDGSRALCRMTLHCEPRGEPHPERPHRIAAIYHHLVRQGLAARCVQLSGTECTAEDARAVHSLQHWRAVQQVGDGSLEPGGDVYANDNTSFCARLSAGTMLDVCRRVLRGEMANGAAVVRPPGHHAEREGVMGFCFINYVAAAAAIARAEFGLKRVSRPAAPACHAPSLRPPLCSPGGWFSPPPPRGASGSDCRLGPRTNRTRRVLHPVLIRHALWQVLIVDWDVHHGNGTENMFLNDRRAPTRPARCPRSLPPARWPVSTG